MYTNAFRMMVGLFLLVPMIGLCLAGAWCGFMGCHRAEGWLRGQADAVIAVIDKL